MAMDEKRNIVPLMMEGFDFGSPTVKNALSGKLASLDHYNGLRLVSDYFFEAMERLRNRYLNTSLEEVHLHPLSKDAKELAEVQKAEAGKAEIVNTDQLREQEKFELENTYGSLRVPILGPIVAGPLMLVPESDINYLNDKEYDAIDIARSLLPSREKGDDLYALEVKGDSMIDAMINDGDIVVMKPASQALNGEMVAVRVNDEFTLKYFYKEKDRYRLQTCQSHFETHYYQNKRTNRNQRKSDNGNSQIR